MIARATLVDTRWPRLRSACAPVVLAAVLVAGIACGSNTDKKDPVSNRSVPVEAQAGNLPPQTRDLQRAQQYGGAYLGGTATGDTQQGGNFARWVLEQDPRRQYLTDAVVRGDQMLGVKVQPNVTKGDIQKLLMSLTQGMAKEFPNRNVSVIAFYQSGDKLAETSYDPNTGRIAVRFV